MLAEAVHKLATEERVPVWLSVPVARRKKQNENEDEEMLK